MNHVVLVVEDNPDNMKLINWVLEDEPYDVKCARTATEAFGILEEVDVDIILMDISLPDVNGMEATKRLRADERFKDLPIIAVTAHAIADETEAILSSGVSALVTKPIDEALLIDTMRRFLPEGANHG